MSCYSSHIQLQQNFNFYFARKPLLIKDCKKKILYAFLFFIFQIGNVQKDTSKLEEENLALKAQIKIFTEDFESERQDREKAQARVNDLEEELLKVNAFFSSTKIGL